MPAIVRYKTEIDGLNILIMFVFVGAVVEILPSLIAAHPFLDCFPFNSPVDANNCPNLEQPPSRLCPTWKLLGSWSCRDRRNCPSGAQRSI
jgi:hypothetical protein